uniref:DSBA oxidoreductase n=1 Tax=uncultured marine thaumarchaeote SAT1000_16_A03 TaxID=1456387 RepID=A0A075I6A4_9ARCH|nr:DSBA oxidoreductase [uncultured marine thaumarchaeote SAT1000_16_A03]
MESDSDDKLPSFFLNDSKNDQESLDAQKRINKTESNETLSDIHTTKVVRSTNRIHLPSLAIGAGIAVACIFCGVLMVNMINSETTPVLAETPQKQTEITKTQSLSVFTDNASPILGNPNAPITMVEFGDYQCTFCSKFFHETENSIITNYIKTGKVKILFKDYIILGQDSINAANAAHCANDQKLFWEYHSMLYNNWAGENTGWADLAHLHEFANTLGLDMDVFSTCMSDLKWNELVNLSSKDGQKLGVSGTPTFFVIDQNNDVVKIVGAQHYDVFKQIFDSVLDE